jgi:thymidylate synthase (FAD)
MTLQPPDRQVSDPAGFSSHLQAELIECMGTDLTVVNAARVSFDRHHAAMDHTDERLIKYLAMHGHWTPFGHPQITLRETVPIFVARQRFKHVVGFVYNEVSRRYVKTYPTMFLPLVWRYAPEGSVKQGSGGPHHESEDISSYVKFLFDKMVRAYDELIQQGVAPEQARMVLPQAMFTSYYVTGSLAAWARAYKQRMEQHAQVEIRELAAEWDRLIRPLYPLSWAALVDGD